MNKKLLTNGKSNTKTAKNSKETYYLSLQPTNLNSKNENLCRFSTKECRNQCLQFAGRQSFSNVVKSRTRKTEYFVTQRTQFLQELYSELEELNKKGNIAVRLNLLSDVDWEYEFNTIGKTIADLKELQLYDYTKDPTKVLMNSLDNYCLTYSYSGGNWQWCEKFLKEKIANVAVVFKSFVPLTYKGFDVINGDETDERFLDKKGVIVGLKYKTPKGVPYKINKFVIDN